MCERVGEAGTKLLAALKGGMLETAQKLSSLLPVLHTAYRQPDPYSLFITFPL